MKTKLVLLVGLATLSAVSFAADKTINDLTQTNRSRQWIETADPAVATCGSPANHPCSRKADTLQAVWDSPNFAMTAPPPAQVSGDVAGTGIFITASDATAGSSTNAGARGGAVRINAGRAVTGMYGGDIVLTPGIGVGGYSSGQVVIGAAPDTAYSSIRGIGWEGSPGFKGPWDFRYNQNTYHLVFTTNGSEVISLGTDSALAGYGWKYQSTGGTYWVSDNASDIGTPDTGLSRVSEGVVGVGTGAHGSTAGTLDLGSLQFKTPAGSQPDCDASTRGQMWFDRGGTGFADVFEVCGKSAADSYAWVAVATF